MTIQDKNVIWLDLFEFLTYQKKVKLLNIFPKYEDIKQSFLSNQQAREILSDLEFNKMSAMLSYDILEKQIEKFTNDGIKMITIFSDEYPAILREISSPPLCLYCLGNTQLLNSYCIAIVGSRKHSDYGMLTTKQYAKEFANNDITIVSGMAIGIDTIAHKTALEENGNTIAVLAGGLYHIYPAVNIKLAREIQKNNLIITESSPATAPLNYLFPIRNRIIAGLSRAVVLPEANLKSGSMHTANFAFEFNREVFAIPGKINSVFSSGTNKLIKDNKANITLSPDDVFDVLNLTKKEKVENNDIQLDINAQIILNYIKTDKKSFQEIAEYTKISIKDLNALLTELEMTGMVIKLANNSYIAT